MTDKARQALDELTAALAKAEKALLVYGRETHSRHAMLMSKIIGIVRLQIEAELLTVNRE